MGEWKQRRGASAATLRGRPRRPAPGWPASATVWLKVTKSPAALTSSGALLESWRAPQAPEVPRGFEASEAPGLPGVAVGPRGPARGLERPAGPRRPAYYYYYEYDYYYNNNYYYYYCYYYHYYYDYDGYNY